MADYKVIIDEYGNPDKEKELTRVITEQCGGCHLVPLKSKTYILQIDGDKKIPDSIRNSLLAKGITLEDHFSDFQNPITLIRDFIDAA